MSYPVTYYCPHCGTLVELEREGYLSDKAVTPYPFEGWEYVDPDEEFEDGAADGVAFVCGESPPTEGWNATEAAEAGDAADAADATDAAVATDTDGCGERFYLSFVKFENGREIDPRHADTDGERVELAEGSGSNSPRGPTGPDGPSGPTGGFY